MTWGTFARAAQRHLPVFLYLRLRPNPPLLVPERLYAYLDALWQRRMMDGAIVEVGCYRGGTTRVACSFLRRTGFQTPYICIDTFSGFRPSHFARDTARHGTASRFSSWFNSNSRQLFERLMTWYGCDVRVIEADIATMDPSALPPAIAVALLDVDLEIPTFEGLTRIWPRLARGGIVLVDDCAPQDNPFPGARAGYQRFTAKHSIPERYFMGMGLLGSESAN